MREIENRDIATLFIILLLIIQGGAVIMMFHEINEINEPKYEPPDYCIGVEGICTRPHLYIEYESNNLSLLRTDV